MRLRDSMRPFAAVITLVSTLLSGVAAIQLDVNSESSVKKAAKIVAGDMVQWYTGGVPGNVASGIPGILPALPEQPTYYWWEAGAMCGVLMDYWYYTGDTAYNQLVEDAMMFQVGPQADYMPPNQTKQLGNDDQAFWGMAAMTAAEYKFPNPPSDQPQWLALAQGVWNSQQLRWENAECGGGLRWQIFIFNLGYDYKNTPANAGFMNLGARLFAYTGNQTYADWAEKTWNWMVDLEYIGPYKQGVWGNYSVFDGGGIDSNCSLVNPTLWTYSAGILLNACSVMYSATQDDVWRERALGIWNSSLAFFTKDQILTEAACEPYNTCNNDQLSFKAYFSRFVAASTKWLPDLYSEAQPYLQTSAEQAALQCSGDGNGVTGTACGMKWTMGAQWDGTYGFGQQFDALEIILTQLIEEATPPVTAAKGGISKGNPSAGTAGDFVPGPPSLTSPITAGDKAGAAILTAFVVGTWLWVIYWMV